MDKIAPLVPHQRLPRCLPPLTGYRDLTPILRNNGLNLKDREWAVTAEQGQIHFCTSAENASLIEDIFCFRCCHWPSTITQLCTLVSIANQEPSNTAWTLDALMQQDPVVHARFGAQGRSGEKATMLTSLPNGSCEYEIEPTLGENSELIDCRISLLAKLEKPKVTINQQTAITMGVKLPFILDCGTHGPDRRNYFLIIYSDAISHDNDNRSHKLTNIDKIKGIYAMRGEAKENNPPASGFTTCAYAADATFLFHLRDKISEQSLKEVQDQGEPKKPKPPARVANYPPDRHFKPGDHVFDITQHVSYLGINTFEGEQVLFNNTRKLLLIHGSRSLHSLLPQLMSALVPSFHTVRVNARIVAADRNGESARNWTMEKIKSANPTYLAHYSTVARSGEKASCGEITHNRPENAPGANKTDTDYRPEFVIEPTVGGSNQHIDLRYHLESKPLGKPRLTVTNTSAVSLPDGKPAIIELGHPASGTRTHLLILNADIITPDGSFYRDRFKPVQ